MSDAGFLLANYPENYFSHIVIDECHRSAWGKWSAVLRRNPDAVHIGLTATPRSITVEAGADPGVRADQEISANNIAYFGEPVYEYSIAQGQEDGFLAACQIVRREVRVEGETRVEVTLDDRVEVAKFMLAEVVLNHNPVDANTHRPLMAVELRPMYGDTSYGRRLIISERANALCDDFFQQLVDTDGPFQKTIPRGGKSRSSPFVSRWRNDGMPLPG